MRFLRDELPQLPVAPPEPVCLAACLVQRRLEPRDLTLEAGDFIRERGDGALPRVRVRRAVDGSHTQGLFEESKHGHRPRWYIS